MAAVVWRPRFQRETLVMSKPPPSKEELDRLNAEIKRLQMPQTPHMAPVPVGSMRQQATEVQIAVRRQIIEEKTERRDEIADRLGAAKGLAKDNFDRER